jgi:hypothetical protein
MHVCVLTHTQTHTHTHIKIPKIYNSFFACMFNSDIHLFRFMLCVCSIVLQAGPGLVRGFKCSERSRGVKKNETSVMVSSPSHIYFFVFPIYSHNHAWV